MTEMLADAKGDVATWLRREKPPFSAEALTDTVG